MNIQSNLRKLYNKIKYLQIDADDFTSENFSRGIYYAGMLDASKLFMKLYNGELTQEEIDFEIAKLEPAEVVN